MMGFLKDERDRLRALLLQVVVHIEGQVSADPSDAALAARLKAALEA